jgi:hypothetical protein
MIFGAAVPIVSQPILATGRNPAVTVEIATINDISG